MVMRLKSYDFFTHVKNPYPKVQSNVYSRDTIPAGTANFRIQATRVSSLLAHHRDQSKRAKEHSINCVHKCWGSWNVASSVQA